jgi:hypothetical protein
MPTYTPRTGAACGCKRGVHRDNCPNCEGTGYAIDFRALHAFRRLGDLERLTFLQREIANGFGLTEDERVEMRALEARLGIRPLNT